MATEPQPALLARKKLIKVGDETTAGTLAGTLSLLPANYYEVKCEPGDFFAEGDRQPDGNYLGRVASVLGKQMGKLEFTMDVAPGGPLLVNGTGTAGYTNLATLAGFVGAAGTLTPGSSLATRVTKSFEVYEDGRKKTLTGCAANITIDLDDGKKVTAKLVISGIWQAVADAAMPAQAPITAAPFVARGLALTVGGVAPATISKVSLDLGATVEEREDITAGSGIAQFLVTELLPKATLDPEARKVADQDVYGLLLGGTTAALAASLVSGGHTLTITAPAIQRVKVTDASRGKRLTDPLDVNLCNSAGDDALTLADSHA